MQTSQVKNVKIIIWLEFICGHKFIASPLSLRIVATLTTPVYLAIV
jgi:hypothetical protein